MTRLKFVLREDADSLVVAANGDGGSLIEVWELLEKPLPVHKLFQPKTQPAEPFKTVVSVIYLNFHNFFILLYLASFNLQLSICNETFLFYSSCVG